MMANIILVFLSNLVDEDNNIYHFPIGKKNTDADCPALTEEIETNPRACKCEGCDRGTVTESKHFSSKGYGKNWSREISVINSVFKTSLWTWN